MACTFCLILTATFLRTAILQMNEGTHQSLLDRMGCRKRSKATYVSRVQQLQQWVPYPSLSGYHPLADLSHMLPSLLTLIQRAYNVAL